MLNSFNDINKQLQNIEQEIKNEIDGFISFEELFDQGFMDRNSNFSSCREFLAFHKIDVDSMVELELVDVIIIDSAVRASTKFSTWSEMSNAACEEYAIKKLKSAGFDISL